MVAERDEEAAVALSDNMFPPCSLHFGEHCMKYQRARSLAEVVKAHTLLRRKCKTLTIPYSDFSLSLCMIIDEIKGN